MSRIPDKIWLFRITHIDNLRHIFMNGLVTEKSSKADPGFISIGDNTLIEYREDMEVPVKPGGKFSEYIPFYLGPRSPMLYQIVTGFDGIKKVMQENIIYLVTSLDILEKSGIIFVYTDGHARANITSFFTMDDINGWNSIDWDLLYSEQWFNTLEDKDRQRRKQAELMIKEYLPVGCIERILVYNEVAEQKVLTLLNETGIDLTVQIKKKAYYDHL